jgi:hypothetical protein
MLLTEKCKQKNATRKLQEDGAAVTDLVTDI